MMNKIYKHLLVASLLMTGGDSNGSDAQFRLLY